MLKTFVNKLFCLSRNAYRTWPLEISVGYSQGIPQPWAAAVRTVENLWKIAVYLWKTY